MSKSFPNIQVTSEPLLLAVLSLFAVISFLAVGGLSRLYHLQQESLGNRWFTRGTADLSAGRFDPAMLEFRTALRYSRDNHSYQLGLAESLIGMKRTQEAYSYLLNLWEREPENGTVNLLLARIAAANGQTEQAQRYYHNAIYAVWTGDQQGQRRETRFELIEYLLRINNTAQAQAELIALAGNIGDDPIQLRRVGDLFLRAQDYEHALAEYRLALKSDRHDTADDTGAGVAAFQLGRYPLALHYLQAAAGGSVTPETQDLLRITELVLQMDPFQRQLSAAHRNKIVVAAFEKAGARLEACGLLSSAKANDTGTPKPDSEPSSAARTWTELKPRITERGLARDPDLIESAMEVVFEIERETASTCGNPTEADRALLLISKLHEGR